MTHFKVEMQLPLRFNPDKNGHRKKIPIDLFRQTYEDILEMVGGINISKAPIVGSWISPKTQRRYDDSTFVFTVLVKSEDKMTISNVPKIKKLVRYKETLKKRFEQEEIYMIATRCTWL